jgi:hypothetical protein
LCYHLVLILPAGARGIKRLRGRWAGREHGPISIDIASRVISDCGPI